MVFMPYSYKKYIPQTALFSRLNKNVPSLLFFFGNIPHAADLASSFFFFHRDGQYIMSYLFALRICKELVKQKKNNNNAGPSRQKVSDS